MNSGAERFNGLMAMLGIVAGKEHMNDWAVHTGCFLLNSRQLKRNR